MLVCLCGVQSLTVDPYSMEELITILQHYYHHNMISEELSPELLSRVWALSGGE